MVDMRYYCFMSTVGSTFSLIDTRHTVTVTRIETNKFGHTIVWFLDVSNAAGFIWI